jgi:hypothetical protein
LGVQAHNHEALDIIANDEMLQKKWAREHGFITGSSWKDGLSKLKYTRIFIKPDWFYKILLEQIEVYKPDVIYLHNIEYFSQFFLSRLRKMKKNYCGSKSFSYL